MDATLKAITPHNSIGVWIGWLVSQLKKSKTGLSHISTNMMLSRRFSDRYEDMADIGGLLQGFHIDTLIYTPAEIDAISSRRFIRTALEEGITIYGN